jgi:ribosomal protein L11 methyltransferase
MAQKKGLTQVKFYVTDDEDGHARLAGVTAGLEGFRSRCPHDPGSLTIHQTSLQEEDWANNWKQYYKPLTVGEKIYIVPEWERANAAPAGRTPIYLNPGLIFGTGSHASTQLCLESLEQHIHPGDKVLDLGCGSGILAISALALGASTAVGCDIDPKAVGIAMENASFNDIGSDRLSVYAGDVLSDAGLRNTLAGQYQVVFANIVADVIIPLSAWAGEFMAEDGLFICSGIIDTRAEEVAEALERNGLHIQETRSRSGWFSYTAKKG